MLYPTDNTEEDFMPTDDKSTDQTNQASDPSAAPATPTLGDVAPAEVTALGTETPAAQSTETPPTDEPSKEEDDTPPSDEPAEEPSDEGDDTPPADDEADDANGSDDAGATGDKVVEETPLGKETAPDEQTEAPEPLDDASTPNVAPNAQSDAAKATVAEDPGAQPPADGAPVPTDGTVPATDTPVPGSIDNIDQGDAQQATDTPPTPAGEAEDEPSDEDQQPPQDEDMSADEQQPEYVPPESQDTSAQPAVASTPNAPAAPTVDAGAPSGSNISSQPDAPSFNDGDEATVIGAGSMTNAKLTAATTIVVGRIERHMDYLSSVTAFESDEARDNEQMSFIETVGNILSLPYEEHALVANQLLTHIKKNIKVFDEGRQFRFMAGLDRKVPQEHLANYRNYIKFLFTIAANWSSRSRLDKMIDVTSVTAQFPRQAMKDNVTRYYREVIAS